MKAPPVLLPGGSKPVVAYLRHSIMVCRVSANSYSRVWVLPYCFPRAIASNNDGQRGAELDGGSVLVVEGTDPKDSY
jgi:hypothetical protein